MALASPPRLHTRLNDPGGSVDSGQVALPRRSTLSCLPSTHLCAGAFWLLPRSENGRELHAQFLPATRSKLLSVGSGVGPGWAKLGGFHAWLNMVG